MFEEPQTSAKPETLSHSIGTSLWCGLLIASPCVGYRARFKDGTGFCLAQAGCQVRFGQHQIELLPSS